ncbi:response regulator [Teredinibacter sp. KSP-S5-2]|uniref:response regulator n=1 Tax=Teredinibacter sp. KSP-S5-2 TaxID=3034506 RepID=UPI0029343A9F|nr:response regulator [Teredinibacter sp. KSP-S5-2]WNO07722.1 response regulator [Teredinibacter sp. KSP-S5-2]
MAELNYKDLSVLVADDFSSFRSIVNGLLQSLGVTKVDMASSGEDAISLCQEKPYDVILCDYNLGQGRNGQHVLEELRHRSLLGKESIFIMVSAEAARNIVMSAYDCEPDDYLMKPITARSLQQRMDRLLRLKRVMKPVYQALEQSNVYGAMDRLTEMSLAEDRYSLYAQKMLGELFIREGQLDKAERLYTRALEVRQVDWARLGLARVKQLKGDLDLAETWLERIVEDNPLFLPAYDVLAENWEQKGERLHVQSTVQRAVDISPMSILRQKRLSDVALLNKDFDTAISALRKTVRLGELSCHGKAEDSIDFARLVSSTIEQKLNVAGVSIAEALEYLDAARDRYELDANRQAQCKLLSGRIHAIDGNAEMAEHFLEEANMVMDLDALDIDLDLDHVSILLALEKNKEANARLDELKVKYMHDQDALQKLDEFLTEPVSDANREMIAEVNREGIDLYKHGEFDAALACFERVRELFPKHVGIQLNIAQTLIGKLKSGQADDKVVNHCQSSLDLVASLIDPDHPQYSRYCQLRRMAIAA